MEIKSGWIDTQIQLSLKDIFVLTPTILKTGQKRSH